MKKLLLSLLLPLSFSIQAVSPASVVKLGGAVVAGALSLWSGYSARSIYSEGKGHNNKTLGAYYALPYAAVSAVSGILAAIALKSALDIDANFQIKSIKIK